MQKHQASHRHAFCPTLTKLWREARGRTCSSGIAGVGSQASDTVAPTSDTVTPASDTVAPASLAAVLASSTLWPFLRGRWRRDLHPKTMAIAGDNKIAFELRIKRPLTPRGFKSQSRPKVSFFAVNIVIAPK